MQRTWALLRPHGDLLANLFLHRALLEHPAIARAIPAGNVAAQRARLLGFVDAIVYSLGDLERGREYLAVHAHLGAERGVDQPVLATIQELWLWALEEGLGPDDSPAVRAAWRASCEAIRAIMADTLAPAAQLPGSARPSLPRARPRHSSM